MVSELDAGPVYEKREYHLHGSAEEVLCRLAADTCDMMLHIALTEPTPVPQRGEVHAFARRTPQQSEIASPPGTLDRFYDFIRMLDAEGYPSAFMKYGPFRLSFRNATRGNGRVEAHVTIVRETDAEEEKA